MTERTANGMCAANNAKGDFCGNMRTEGSPFCHSHQPRPGDAPEAVDEELDAGVRLKRASERVDQHVAEATTVGEVGNRLLAAFDVLLQMTNEQIAGGVEAINQMLEVIQKDRDTVRQDLDFLLADFNLIPEQRQLLAAQAIQNGQSMGELLSDLVSERLTWDEGSIAVLIDPVISVRVKELAHGRSTEPVGIINGALQYCIENEAL